MGDEAPFSSALVVMGVSGSGKSTIAAAVAADAGALFLDADDFHPAANTAKMAAGVPLTDDDRRPWLEAVGDEIARHTQRGERVVVACSSLKRAYRDALRRRSAGLTFAHLHGSGELLAARIGARSDHFMPPALLASQLSTLEPLDADELGFVVDIAPSPSAIVAAVLEGWRAAAVPPRAPGSA